MSLDIAFDVSGDWIAYVIAEPQWGRRRDLREADG